MCVNGVCLGTDMAHDAVASGGGGAGGVNNNTGGTGGVNTNTGGNNNTGGNSAVGCDAAAVAALLGSKCNGCHSNAFNSEANLASQIDAVPLRNANCEVPIVVAGDPFGSLLFQKVSGTQSEDCGNMMPAGGGVALTQEELACVSDWITSLP
jgi:hypothetical protein